MPSPPAGQAAIKRAQQSAAAAHIHALEHIHIHDIRVAQVMIAVHSSEPGDVADPVSLALQDLAALEVDKVPSAHPADSFVFIVGLHPLQPVWKWFSVVVGERDHIRVAEIQAQVGLRHDARHRRGCPNARESAALGKLLHYGGCGFVLIDADDDDLVRQPRLLLQRTQTVFKKRGPPVTHDEHRDTYGLSDCHTIACTASAAERQLNCRCTHSRPSSPSLVRKAVFATRQANLSTRPSRSR